MSDIGTEKNTVDSDKGIHKCNLCSLSYGSEKNLREHFWSLMHHTNIEQKQKKTLHICTLCFTSCSGIAEYRKHLNGEKHKNALEENRSANDDNELNEERETERRESDHRGTEKVDMNSTRVEDNGESGGFSRDPVFYRKKKSRHSREMVRDHSKQDQVSPYDDDEPPYDPHNSYWDLSSQCVMHGYNDNNHPPADWFGEQNFPMQYRWCSPEGDLERFPAYPPKKYANVVCTQFERGRQHREPQHRDYGMYNQNYNYQKGHHTEHQNLQDVYTWNRNNNRMKRMEEQFDSISSKESCFETKKKKKKKKFSSASTRDVPASKSFKSPDGANERKRVRGVDSEATVRKSSRIGEKNRNIKAWNSGDLPLSSDNIGTSDLETDTLSSSVRSTSSNKSKSSIKSKSTCASPGLKKSASSRKLLNSRVSPKNFKVSPKIKRANNQNRLAHNEQGNGDADISVLEKAENLCRELREKRQKARQANENSAKLKKNEIRKTINDQINSLNNANKSRIKGHLIAAEKQMSCDSEKNILENGTESFSSPQQFTNQSVTTATSGTTTLALENDAAPNGSQSFNSDIDRIRHNIETSVRRSLSSPAKPLSSVESPKDSTRKVKKPLSKDALLKMVNSPRSRNERMHLARMLRTHAKTQTKLAASRLSVQLNGQYDNCEFDEEGIPGISLEDLPPEVKLQIAQLIEDDVITTDMDCLENTLMSGSTGTPAKTNARKASRSGRAESMDESPSHITIDNVQTVEADEVLSIHDLATVNAHAGPSLAPGNRHEVRSRPESTDQTVTVTSVNGVPQLQIIDSTSVSHSQESTRTDQPNQDVPPTTPFTVALELGRRALQMSGLNEKSNSSPTSASAPIYSTPVPNSDQVTTGGVELLLTLSEQEDEKQKEIDELDKKIDVMRQMLKRTIEHLERSEERRRELYQDTKKLKEERIRILKGLTSQPASSTSLLRTQVTQDDTDVKTSGKHDPEVSVLG